MADKESRNLFHQERVFEDQVVYLSGNVYFDCVFRRCTLVVRDRMVPPMSNCKVEASSENWRRKSILRRGSAGQAVKVVGRGQPEDADSVMVN